MTFGIASRSRVGVIGASSRFRVRGSKAKLAILPGHSGAGRRPEPGIQMRTPEEFLDSGFALRAPRNDGGECCGILLFQSRERPAEILRLKRREIVDPFADADEMDRQLELLGDRNKDAAARGAVELGHD